MNDVQELIGAVQAAGAILRADGSNLKIKPSSRVPDDLKARLKQHKTEILRHLELEASMRRLEAAGICIAVWEVGSMRVLISESDTIGAIDADGTIYNPSDIYHYVTLTTGERRMLHEFKRRFGGTTEWRFPSTGTRG